MTYQLHPLSALFPRLEGGEFEALKADLKANGQQQPIILHDGLILDGGNRYRACVESGIEPKFDKFAGGDPVQFVLSANLHRRHLSPGQQAAVVAAAQDWARAHVAGNNQCCIVGNVKLIVETLKLIIFGCLYMFRVANHSPAVGMLPEGTLHNLLY